MNRDQMLSDLGKLREQIIAARVTVESLERDRDQLMITAAMAATPVTEIVAAAGVTRARFYQVKDRIARDDAP